MGKIGESEEKINNNYRQKIPPQGIPLNRTTFLYFWIAAEQNTLKVSAVLRDGVFLSRYPSISTLAGHVFCCSCCVTGEMNCITTLLIFILEDGGKPSEQRRIWICLAPHITSFLPYLHNEIKGAQLVNGFLKPARLSFLFMTALRIPRLAAKMLLLQSSLQSARVCEATPLKPRGAWLLPSGRS